MRKRDLATLVEQLIPHLPRVRVKLPMIAFPPFEELLKGLYFERSGSDVERFYIWVFFMPLCVPAQHVTFNLGRRIGGGDQRWDFRDPQLVEKIAFSIKNDAFPFLESIQNSHDAARLALSISGATTSPHLQQANAYLLAQSGETNEASKSLDDLLYLLKLDVPWQAEIAARARKLKTLLSSPKDAESQIRAWEDESVRNLGLEEIGFAATAR